MLYVDLHNIRTDQQQIVRLFSKMLVLVVFLLANHGDTASVSFNVILPRFVTNPDHQDNILIKK